MFAVKLRGALSGWSDMTPKQMIEAEIKRLRNRSATLDEMIKVTIQARAYSFHVGEQLGINYAADRLEALLKLEGWE